MKISPESSSRQRSCTGVTKDGHTDSRLAATRSVARVQGDVRLLEGWEVVG
jgi:hypothetical protein